MSYLGAISAKEHYTLRLVIWLARTYKSAVPVSLTMVHQEEGISLKYLEQLIRPFLQAKWCQSVKGRHGGYVMIKDPSSVTLKDILWLTHPKHKVIECLSPVTKKRCPMDSVCPSRKVWMHVSQTLNNILEEITLAGLLSGSVSETI